MKRLHWLRVFFAVLALGFGWAFWEYAVSDWIEPHPHPSDATAKSTDLRRDIRRMWGTGGLRGITDESHGPNPRASTDRAINAASRVFNTVELVGKTPEEVAALLGDPRSSNDSVYNFPFWPAERRAMVYRFDSGMYGWQFTLPLDDEGRVREVRRDWIH